MTIKKNYLKLFHNKKSFDDIINTLLNIISKIDTTEFRKSYLEKIDKSTSTRKKALIDQFKKKLLEEIYRQKSVYRDALEIYTN